jgi:hypothetical protein
MVRPPKIFVLTPPHPLFVRHFALLIYKSRARTDRVRQSLFKSVRIQRLPTVLSKIPDPLQNFSVTQNIFAVKWRREFAKDRYRAVAFGYEFKGNRLKSRASL